MQWWMLPSLTGTGLALAAGVYGYRYLQRPANLYLALLTLAAAWVCAMQWAALLLPDNLGFRYLMAQLQYLGFTTGPVLWLLTALAYCNYKRALHIARLALWVIPAITLALTFSNPLHGQIWREFELVPGTPSLHIVYGHWFNVHVFYVYGLVAVGTVLWVQRFARARGYLLQLLTILFAPLAIFGVNFIYLLGLNPLPIDPTPTGLAVAALLVALATRKRLFSVAPIARRITLDSLFEGVIVVSEEGRIADTNLAAREILGIGGSGVGNLLTEYLPEAEAIQSAEPLDVERPDGRTINVRITGIGRNRDGDQERLAVLRDVSNERAAKKRLMQVQRELQELNAALETMAHTDSLTGLVNRRRLKEVFKTEWSRAIRHDRPLSFILLDFDHFKQINDTYGHLAGDEVLERAGETLRQSTRPEDVVARYGGEEFAILLPETDLDMAICAAHRLHQALGELRFDFGGRDRFQATTSIGIASREASDGSMEALMVRADAALYHSKHSGRNSISAAKQGKLQLLDRPAALDYQI